MRCPNTCFGGCLFSVLGCWSRRAFSSTGFQIQSYRLVHRDRCWVFAFSMVVRRFRCRLLPCHPSLAVCTRVASLVVPCLGFAGCGCLCHFSGVCGLVLCCTRPRGVCGAVGSGPFPPSGVCVRCGCGIGPACWYVEEAVYCLD